jgi:hypothetical protein
MDGLTQEEATTLAHYLKNEGVEGVLIAFDRGNEPGEVAQGRR